MTIKVNGFDGSPFDQNSIFERTGPFIKTKHKLTFSGSYVSGGDVFDFTNGGVNSAVPPLGIRLVFPSVDAGGAASSVSNVGGNYIAVPPAGAVPSTNFTGWKLKIWTGAGAEYSAGAYGADVLTDDVFVEAVWAKY